MKLCYNEATTMGCPDSSLLQDILSCRDAGFRYMEFRFDKLEPYLAENTPRQLKSLLEESGIHPVSYNALYLYPELYTDQDDPARRAEIDRWLGLAAELSDVLETRDIIAVVPLHRDRALGPYTAPWEYIRDNCVRILKQMAAFCRPYGLRLALETVGNPYSAVRTVEKTMEIIELVGQENVGFAADSYNIYQYDKSNDFSALAAIPPEKLFVAHINNADDVPLEQITQADRRFCDSGVIDLKAYLAALDSLGYDGPVSVEMVRPEYWQYDTDQMVREAYRTTCLAMGSYRTE